ncbi:Zinc finger, RING-type, partial [Corchorus capsularis]
QEQEQQQHLASSVGEQLGIVRYKCNTLQQGGEFEEEESCAVCLCKIEEDDEMRELRCNHLFHKACLDKWLGYSLATTCPICRTFLIPAKIVSVFEVILFNYSNTFTSSDHRENWWLR